MSVVVEHKPIHDLESPGVEPVLMSSQRNMIKNSFLIFEIDVDRWHIVVLWGIRIKVEPKFFKAQRIRPCPTPTAKVEML